MTWACTGRVAVPLRPSLERRRGWGLLEPCGQGSEASCHCWLHDVGFSVANVQSISFLVSELVNFTVLKSDVLCHVVPGSYLQLQMVGFPGCLFKTARQQLREQLQGKLEQLGKLCKDHGGHNNLCVLEDFFF